MNKVKKKNLERLHYYLSRYMKIKKERPFVCDGSPYECEAFLVGINPAYSFERSFWKYWDDDRGFNLKSWLEDFQKSRRRREGKSSLTRTRYMIEKLREELKDRQISLLDLNLYLKPTPRANFLTASDKNTDVFRFLVNEIKPRLIYLHGNQPRMIFEENLGIKIEKNKFVYHDAFNLFATNHLSYQISRESMTEVAHKLAQHLKCATKRRRDISYAKPRFENNKLLSKD